MLTKISKVNQTKLLKFITNPVIDSTLILNKKQSVKCIGGICKDCIFSSNNNYIEQTLRDELFNKEISCYHAKCIFLSCTYKLIEK